MPRILKALIGVVLPLLIAACSAPPPPSSTEQSSASLRGIRRTELHPTNTKPTRHAFVIGNSEYQHLPDLRNPRADAQAMAELLTEAEFQVFLHLDTTRKRLLNALDEFQQRLVPDSVVLIYYAGHAVQVAGRNHLIPVDADLHSELDVETESLAVDRLLGKLENRRTRLKLFLLDACRNNPFPSKYRGIRQGLADIRAPAGTLIAYATSPGTVALDGNSLHSPYTASLLHHLRSPGLKIEDALKRVRTDLVLQTDLRQVPWESSSLYGEDFMLFPAAAELAPADSPGTSTPAPSLSRSHMEEAFAELMAQESASYDPEPQAAQWERFLRDYPDDFPHTDSDNDLRRIATQHLIFWKARVTEAQNPERRKAWAAGMWTEPHAGLEFVAVTGNAHFRMGNVLGDEDGEVTVRMVPR
ncbi:MAG: caspase family protein, partial [SAR324 cluster bacterium]|nr:caspase family protein [SAR324 cluster bacterium]